MMTKKEIEQYGIIRFYSDYGKHKIAVEVPGDANIEQVGEAFRGFLLATGFSPSTVNSLLGDPP